MINQGQAGIILVILGLALAARFAYPRDADKPQNTAIAICVGAEMVMLWLIVAKLYGLSGPGSLW